MKVGDKVYCIEDIGSFKKCNYYKVHSTDFPYIALINHIDYYNNHFDINSFKRHFRTIKQMRKEKLDKINEDR